jgi:hypothetical protein
MATFTITITNKLDFYGMSETYRWGSMVWGTDNWATTEDIDFKVFKIVTNTMSHSDSLTKFVFLAARDYGTVTFSDALTKFPMLGAKDFGTITGTMVASPRELDADSGFYYVWTDDKGVDGFSKTADGTDDFSKTADGTDDWSAL